MPLGILILAWIALATVFVLTAEWVIGSGPGGGQTGVGTLMSISIREHASAGPLDTIEIHLRNISDCERTLTTARSG